MLDPITFALTVQAAVFITVILYVCIFCRLPLTPVVVFTSLCLPVALIQYKGQKFFASDVACCWLIFHLITVPRARPVLSGASKAILVLYAFGIVTWSLVSTRLAVTSLGEVFVRTSLEVFIVRSVFYIALYLWAYRLGSTHYSYLGLLMIPILCWTVYAAAGLAQFAGVWDVDAFWARDGVFNLHHEPTSGFMGMDKPQLALWANYVTLMAMWLRLKAPQPLRWLLAATAPLSAVIVVLIGSRQGTLYLVLGIVGSIGIQAVSGRRAPQLPLMISGICVFGLILPVLWSSVDPSRVERALASFQVFDRASSINDLANERDSTSLPLLDYITQSPHRLFLGSGVATENSGYDEKGRPYRRRTYAEGEFERLLWSGGFVALGSYLTILILIFRTSIQAFSSARDLHIHNSACLLFMLSAIGVLFCFGQYHLFTVLYHNIPCSYILWASLGLLLGLLKTAVPIQGPRGWSASAWRFVSKTRLTSARFQIPS
jgi:hypothetical protein